MSADSMVLAKLKYVVTKLEDMYSVLQEMLDEDQFTQVESSLMSVGETVSDVIEQLK